MVEVSIPILVADFAAFFAGGILFDRFLLHPVVDAWRRLARRGE